MIRSNLSVALADIERPTVIVTSAYSGEGKTVTCANLARSLALAGHRVVLVDLDLRHPDAHRILGAHNEFGVSDVLLDRRQVDACLQFIDIGKGAGGAARGLYVLATGRPVAEPAELLGAGRMAKLLDALSRQADIVLIDTPPVLPVADTLIIGRMVSGAVMVVEARRTPIPAVQKAKDALIRNQTRLIGVVVNKMQQRDATYGYGYGYGYGEVPESESAVNAEANAGSDSKPEATSR